jgi:hypothetical protein
LLFNEEPKAIINSFNKNQDQYLNKVLNKKGKLKDPKNVPYIQNVNLVKFTPAGENNPFLVNFSY